MGSAKQKNRKFIYKTKVTWTGEKKGLVYSAGKPGIEVATPPEFGGHEGMWSPEELFVSAVNTCIKTTFLHYARKNDFEFLSYESEAEGTLENVANRFMFSLIKIRPKIKVASEVQVEKAKELIELSVKNCLISNSIKTNVEVEPEISAGVK